MAQDQDFKRELAQLLQKYGLSEDLPRGIGSLSGGMGSLSGGSGGIENIPGMGAVGSIQGPARLGSNVASWIREIITGDQAFDQRILERVGVALQGFAPK